MTGITQAALAERNAQSSLNKASAEWRSAWWETTMVLSAVPNPERAAAARQASVILGQSERYLGQRRLLGQRLARYSLTDVRGLPPRLALEYVLRIKADPARIHEVLEDAQKRSLSLRDLAREMGSQPESWKREGERRALPKTDAAAVLAALDALDKAIPAFIKTRDTALPEEVTRVARHAAETLPAVSWLASLERKASAA